MGLIPKEIILSFMCEKKYVENHRTTQEVTADEMMLYLSTYTEFPRCRAGYLVYMRHGVFAAHGSGCRGQWQRQREGDSNDV